MGNLIIDPGDPWWINSNVWVVPAGNPNELCPLSNAG
jgi:hypothetical protein